MVPIRDLMLFSSLNNRGNAVSERLLCGRSEQSWLLIILVYETT